MTYVVHGAAGAQGGPVVAALVKAGMPVAALSRNAAPIKDGVGTVVADFRSGEALTKAYEDAEGVFVHLPLGLPQDVETFARNIAEALVAARPDRIVVSTSGLVVGEPDNPLNQTTSPVNIVIDALEHAGLAHAIISPRLFNENLLLPPVIDGVKKDGVLRYPLRADFKVSWASHLDIADVAVELFNRPNVTGIVGVGHMPPLSGPDLAAAFARHLGRAVEFQSISPEQFGVMVTPVIGEGAAHGVAGLYRVLGQQNGHVLSDTTDAQTRLNTQPRAIGRWLADLGVNQV